MASALCLHHTPDYWKLVQTSRKPAAWHWEKRCRLCQELLFKAPTRANGTTLQNLGLVDKNGYLTSRAFHRIDKT